MKIQIPEEVLNFKQKNPKNFDFHGFDTKFVSNLYDLIESGQKTLEDDELPNLYAWFKSIIESEKQSTLIFFLRTHNSWKNKQENLPE